MAPAWRNFKNIFFTICTWPNGPVGARILSGFQFEGKTDVWISQVRHVKRFVCMELTDLAWSPLSKMGSREKLPLTASIRKGMGTLMSSYLYIMY